MQADFDTLYPSSFSEFDPRVITGLFTDDTIVYLNALSSHLLAQSGVRQYPDVVTLAFFCRKGNVMRLRQEFVRDGEIRLGRGMVFHIAPSNVPVNFAYSMVAGLLAGNTNVVRVSSKAFKQVDMIVKAMSEISNDHPAVSRRIAVVRYDRSSDATAFFSSTAAARMIWGGDATIAAIRAVASPARSLDICFTDRYSLAVIVPQAVVRASDAEMSQLVNGFYNDTYLFDQNACSAPHLVVWLDDPDCSAARTRFWTRLHSLVQSKYQLQPVMAVDKLTALYKEAANRRVKRIAMPDNLLFRVEMDSLQPGVECYRGTCGYFNECVVHSLEDICKVVTPQYQTLAYYGFDAESMHDMVLRCRPAGIDRIVPIGHTTDFSLNWDGFNLIDTLSRITTVM